jgi:glyoxylase-like metal-dependent hydrolase (beta-lactamase superfamily II)
LSSIKPGETPSAPASARTARPQSPYFYRFKLGDADVSVVTDGPLELGDASSNFVGVSEEEVRRMLARHYLPTDDVVLEQNVPVVEIGGKTVLFETGMGEVKIFGPRTGQLQKSLRAAGIDPASVDAVVLSHAHIDHAGGVCAPDGTPLFPDAQIYISERDFIDWTDESRLSSPFGNQVEVARKILLPVRDRLVFFKDGQEFLPGIQAIAAPGHTFGHHCFMVSSAGASFCFLGDLTHHHVLLMEKPLMEFAYDADPKQSAQTRTRLLGMLADQRIPVMSYHFAWPGFGNVGRDGDGFRYFPAPMQLDPL